MLDRTLEDALPYLFALLGIVSGEDPLAAMDLQVRKRKTLEAIKRILLRESLQQPLIVIIEDLHWIDEETQELLNLLADSIGTATVLLLVNYRPEYSHHWNSKTYYTQIRLDPLGNESADEMLTAQLGDGVELVPLKRLIIEKTEGNPFFMEEMVLSLFEEGVLARNGAVKLTRSLSQLKIPPTVQAILVARIDRLPPDGKELLQTLASIGREFAFGLLRVVVNKSEDDLNRLLHNLQLAEFIYERPAVGDAEYVFKHALTQEVAYNSILSERRRMLHERAARAIESLYAWSLDDHLADLAGHYSRSENGEKAAEYLGRAGEQSVQRAAYTEAEAYLDAGLQRIRALPESLEHSRAELRIQIAEGQLFRETIGTTSPGAIVSFNRARELCTMIGDDVQLFQVLDGLRRGSLFRLELEKARRFAEEQMGIAGRSSDPAKTALASAALGEVLWWMGDFTAARRYLEPAFSPGFGDLRGIELDHLAVCRSLGALALLMLGFADQANKLREQTLAWARSLSFPVPTADAFLLASMLDNYSRSSGSALEYSKISIEISAQHGTQGSSAFTLAVMMKGWALSNLGQVDEGIAVIREGIAAAESTGMLVPTWGLLPLAEAYLRAGRAGESGELVDQMLERLQRTGHRHDEADIYRLKGEISLIRDQSDKPAEKCFRTAIEVARAQSGKLYELRATVSLARLLSKQGKHDEARAMLAAIYHWFTEGFDTADLRDAKALLDELGG